MTTSEKVIPIYIGTTSRRVSGKDDHGERGTTELGEAAAEMVGGT
jgi:hypothetical protein